MTELIEQYPKEYDWEQVKQDYPGWPAALHPHARRLVEAHLGTGVPGDASETDGEDREQAPSIRSATHQGSTTESLSTGTPELYLERLLPSDREIVQTAASDLIAKCQEALTQLEAHTRRLQELPDRIEHDAGRAAEVIVESITAAKENVIDARSATPVHHHPSEALQNYRRARDALHHLQAGGSLSALSSECLDLPRMAMPAKRRQAAMQQLAARLSDAQDRVLRAEGITDPSTLLSEEMLQATVNQLLARRGEIGKYLAGTVDLADALSVDQLNPRFAVAASVDKLDLAALNLRLKELMVTRLRRDAKQAYPPSPNLNAYNDLYSDTTLAGYIARQQFDRDLKETWSAAYQDDLVVRGLDRQLAMDRATSQIEEWGRYAQIAGLTLLDTSMPGDVLLEHYTQAALTVMLSGGLKPKSEHGRSIMSASDRSRLLHFTSRQDKLTANNMNYTMNFPKPELGRQIRSDLNLKPVRGIFTIPLADAVEGGLKSALYTTKEVDGIMVPEDMVLAEADGTPASVGIDKLDIVIQPFKKQPAYAVAPYDQALRRRLDELKVADQQNPGEMPWKERVARYFDKQSIAQEVLVAEGVDPTWASEHVFVDEKTVIASHQPRQRQVVIPLAKIHANYFDIEHVDGYTKYTQNRVYLGVATL